MAREAAREMPADGSHCLGVLVPGVPHCPPRVPASSPGQSRRSGSPVLHNVPAGSGAAAVGAVRGGGLGPGQRLPRVGHKTTGSWYRSPPARPSRLSGGAGACCPAGTRDQWQRPGSGAALVSASPFRHFLSLFFRRCGTDRIIVPGNVALCNHKICWQPGWEEGANYAIL